MIRVFRLLTVVAALGLLAAACGDDDGTADAETTTAATTDDGTADDGDTDDTAATGAEEEASGTITVYSGRSEELVAPLFEQFTEDTGVEVELRYGDTAELAAQLLEEGENSPADVFFAQDAGALGAVAAEGLFTDLPEEQLGAVEEALRSTEGQWVGVSGRARVVVYNTDELTEDDLPDSILEFTDPEWEGRLGWAPTNGSFQAFVTALRVLEGEDGAEQWLTGIRDNGVRAYEGNAPIVQAVGDGEIDAGFVNHYYAFQLREENPDLPVANKYFGGGDPGGLVNIAGVGVLGTSDNPAGASALVDYLLSEEGQTYFAEESYEIPIAAGVEPVDEVPSIDELTLPEIDLDQLEDLPGTLELLGQLGIV
jgi:iron(III) transport system substrate-binding protein